MDDDTGRPLHGCWEEAVELIAITRNRKHGAVNFIVRTPI